MKVAITADLHLSSYKRELVNPLDQIRLALFQFINYVNENDIDIVIVAGDIFHDKVLIYKNALDVLLETFSSLTKDIPLYFIAGNHDMGRYGCLLNYVTGLPNLTVVSETPLTIDNMLLVPYSKQQLELIYNDYNGHEILISHFGVNEAKLQSGISHIDPIKLNDLKPFKKVILGHYHLPQEVGNVVYVGNIAHLDWGDKNQQKRFIVLDTETYEVESIPITSIRMFYEFRNPTEEEVKKAQQLIEEGHIVRIFSDKHTRDDIAGATIIHTVEYESKFKDMSDLYEIACKYIENHPEKDALVNVLDEIKQHI